MIPAPRRRSFAPARELTPFRLFLLTGINARLRQGYGGQAHVAQKRDYDGKVQPRSRPRGNQV